MKFNDYGYGHVSIWLFSCVCLFFQNIKTVWRCSVKNCTLNTLRNIHSFNDFAIQSSNQNHWLFTYEHRFMNSLNIYIRTKKYPQTFYASYPRSQRMHACELSYHFLSFSQSLNFHLVPIITTKWYQWIYMHTSSGLVVSLPKSRFFLILGKRALCKKDLFYIT